jgi:hypothetical protein
LFTYFNISVFILETVFCVTRSHRARTTCIFIFAAVVEYSMKKRVFNRKMRFLRLLHWRELVLFLVSRSTEHWCSRTFTRQMLCCSMRVCKTLAATWSSHHSLLYKNASHVGVHIYYYLCWFTFYRHWTGDYKICRFEWQPWQQYKCVCVVCVCMYVCMNIRTLYVGMRVCVRNVYVCIFVQLKLIN